MPRSIPAGLKNWLDHAPLLETHSTMSVYMPFSEDATTYYFATLPALIGGNDYRGALKTVGELKLSMGRSTDRLDVRVTNVDANQAYVFLQSRDALRGNLVKVGRLYRNPAVPGIEYHIILFTGTINSVSTDENEVQLGIVSDLNAGATIGATQLVAPDCQFKYKDLDTCAYTGGMPTCSKVYDDAVNGCLAHANQYHYGGAIFSNNQKAQQTLVGGPPAVNQLVKINGVPLQQRTSLNILTGATATDNPDDDSTDVSVIGGDKTLLNNAVAVTARPKINLPFLSPLAWEDDSANNQTILRALETDSALRNLAQQGGDPLGGSDNHDLFQTLVNQGAKMVLQAGNYRIDSPIVFNTASEFFSFILEGHGMGSTQITYTGTGNLFEFPNAACSDFQVKDLRIICTNPANTGDCFHFMSGSGGVNTNILIENVGIFNFGGWAINGDNIQSSSIVGLRSRGHKKGHIRLYDSDDIIAVKEPNSNVIDRCTLDNLRPDDNNVASIYLFHANGVRITNTTIQGNFYGSSGVLRAIYAENCDTLQIDGLWVEDLCSGGTGVQLIRCRNAVIDGYHGSGGYPSDFTLEMCRGVSIRGATLTNSVPHVVSVGDNFGVIVEDSTLSHPFNTLQGRVSGHRYIDAQTTYHSNPDPNFTDLVGTNALYTGWAENWFKNPNLVDDAAGWTFDAAYVSRVETGSPGGVGGYFLFNPGPTDGDNLIGVVPLQQIISIPDDMFDNYWTVSYDVYIESLGAASHAGRHVGLGVSATGQSEHTIQWPNTADNYSGLLEEKWYRWSTNVYVPEVSIAGTDRTITFRIKPEETTKGPDTPRIRIGNFRLAPGREAQPGGLTKITEERTHTFRGPDGVRFSSRPSAAAPPSGEAGLRGNNGTLEEYDHLSSTWRPIGSGAGGPINIKSAPYLAKGDGTTDDTAAIQDAHDDALAAGKALYGPGGHYLVTGLDLSPKVLFFGDGDENTIIQSVTNAPIINCVGSGGFGPQIERLAVKGSKTAGTSQIGLKCDAASGAHVFRVRDVKITETGSVGLFVGKAEKSHFENILIDDCAGWALEYDSAGEGNIFDVRVGKVSTSFPAAFRINSGNFHLIGGGSFGAVRSGSWCAILGRKNGLFGESTDNAAFAHFADIEFKNYHAGAVYCLRGSDVKLSGRCLFARYPVQSTIASSGIDDTQIAIPVAGNLDDLLFPAGPNVVYVVEGSNVERIYYGSRTVNVLNSCVRSYEGTTAHVFTTAAIVYSAHAVGIKYDVDTSGSPTLAYKGTIDDECLLKDGGQYYARSCFIHANDLPPLLLNGEGVQTPAGTIHSYYNSTRDRAEELMRADGFMPRLKITGAFTFNNPGARLIRCDFSAGATLTLWKATLERYPQPVIIYDGAGDAATNNIALAAGGGSTINGGAGYVINQNKGVVIVVADAEADTWRVIAAHPPQLPTNLVDFTGTGNANALAVFDDDNTIKKTGLTISGTDLVTTLDLLPATDNGADLGGVSQRFGYGYFGIAVVTPLVSLGSNVYVLTGSGSPEGAATAGPGSIYLRTDGTCYKKLTGTGNTGWALQVTVTDGYKGDIVVSASGATWTVENDAVTFAKMQNIATDKLLGRSTAATGDIEEISIGAGLDLTSGTLSATGGGGGGGAQFDSGVFASLPASPASDDVYLVSDGHTLERHDGTDWESFGPIYRLKPPPLLTNWAQINTGGGSIFEDQPRALHIFAPYTGANNLRGLDVAAPGGAYTVTALLEIQISNQDYHQAGLMFGDNSGKYETFELASITGVFRLRVNRYNSPTSTAGSTPYNAAFYPTYRIWMRIRDDNSSNRLYSWSIDSKNWIQVHAEGRTNHITATRIGFFANTSLAADPINIRLLHWEVL